MAKSASTLRRTALIKRKLKSTNCHSHTKVSYIDDNGVEQIFYDAMYPIKIEMKGTTPKYANTSYTPAAAQVDFKVINRGGEYSPNNITSGKNGILVKDRQFKIYDGKYLTEAADEQNITPSLSDAYTYYTIMDTSVNRIELSPTNADGNSENYFNDLFAAKYDEAKYDEAVYTPAGYFVMTIDREFAFIENWTRFIVNCATAGHSIYWRAATSLDDLDNIRTRESTFWHYAGETISGDNEVTLNVTRSRYLQIAVIYNPDTWTEDISTSVTFYWESHVEWILLGTFLLDEPEFIDPPGAEMSSVDITGRNVWKRSLKSKINLENITGKYIHEVIKLIADQAKIDYSGTSIADLTSFGARTLTDGLGDQIVVEKIYEKIMQIIGRSYRMWTDENNVLYVTQKRSDYAVDIVYNYKHYIKAKETNQSDKQLQRVTAFNEQKVIDEVSTLGSDTFTTDGDQEISWANDAIAKYWEKTINSGNLDITDVEFDDANKKAIFTLSGAGSITITVKGCEFDSGSPAYFGEAADVDNLENNNGNRIQLTNELLISKAEAKAVAERHIEDFGTPVIDIDLDYAFLDSLTQASDQALVVSEDLFYNQIFQVISITYEMGSETEKYSEFELHDTGRTFYDVIYDLNYFEDIGFNWEYDIGLIYDSDYRIGVTRSEILAQKTYTTDIY